MAINTPIASLPYPELDDQAHVPQYIEGLATALDSLVIPRFVNTTARDNAITSPVAGQVAAVAGALYLYSGSAWQEVPPKNLFVMKTADESRVASSVYDDDDHLLLALAANTRYRFQFIPLIFGNINEDIKFRFTFPSGATLDCVATMRLYVDAGSVVGNLDTGSVGADTSSPSGEFAQASPANTGTIYSTGIYQGIITIGATPGNFRLQWAGVGGGLTVVLKQGSWLEAWKV